MKTLKRLYDRLSGIVHLLILILFTILLSTGRLAAQLVTTCTNSDFDLGNFNDWTGCYGTFYMSGANPVLQPCTTQGFAQHYPNPGRRHIIMVGPGYYDSYTCDSLITVFPGEAYSARLGDTSEGGHAEELKYQINVNNANYLFIYRYGVVLESPNHAYNQQPGFEVAIESLSGTILDSTCGYYLIYAPTCNNPPHCPTPGGWHYCPNVGYQGDGCYWKAWTTVGMDLTPYFGQTIQIVFITHGCAYTAHRGYAYISAYCNYLQIHTSLCQGDSTAMLIAPPGFRYLWSNSDTTDTIVVPHPLTGQIYSCTLTALNGCQVTIVDTLTYTVIVTNFYHGPACSALNTQFNDSSYVTQNAVTGWKWNFGDGTPLVTGIKNPTHIFALPGTYNVKLVSNSTEGCKDSITKAVIVTLSPTATISGTIAVCKNSTPPLITFTGSSSAPPYTFTYNINGGSNQQVTASGGNSVTVAAPTNVTGTFTYNLVSVQAGSCTQLQTGSAVVTVNPLPTATISGTTSVCQNSTTPLITFTGGSTTAPYTFTYNINGGANQQVTTVVGNSVTVAAPTNVAGIFTYNLVSVQDGSPTACSQTQTGNAVVTVNPLPTATISGTIGVCQNSAAPLITFTGGSSTPPYTFTYNINGGANQQVTTVVGNSVTVAAPTNVVGSFTYNLISVQDGSPTACSQSQTGSAVVTVNPLPTATIAGTTAICKNSAAPLITFTGSSSTAPYTFTYNINGGANQQVTTVVGNSVTVAAPTNVAGIFAYNLVSVQDGSPTACSQTQSGSATITVNPLPTATISGTITVCQNSVAPLITFTGGSSTPPYTFTYNINLGTNQQVTTTAGNSVTVAAPTDVVGSFTYNLVSVQDGSATACSQPQTGSAVVTVNPVPAVSYTLCHDNITTIAAQSIKLEGGIPLGGSFSGAGVIGNIFNPATAGVGNHTITYTYTNFYGCSDNATQTITVVNVPVFTCGNNLTDIRDNQKYATVKLGTRCWMAANLNFGTNILSTSMQRDNCINEKYCYNDDAVNCTNYGGLYQWDEMMRYDSTPAEQGFCPPGWHVPTENDWNNLFLLYVSNGFAGAPLKYTGYTGFNAFLSGVRFNNISWNFSNFAIMFWSSTKEAPGKAWAHGMNTYNPSVSYYPSSKTHAFALRCIQD